ncbi:MAG TPA: sulfite exporter TauE/SafE family protein, partial [Chitinophagaceae bacterium]|nr:sulfite exporter TauE/SafE family protein [Chitinophagaceae bacterium]
MEILGYVAALAIGISLGMIGGGGSILAVPVMVYLFGVQPLLATSYSLFIVGSTSFVGAFSSFRKGLVNLKTALLFGSSSIVTVFVTRRLIIPLVPENILALGSFVLTESILIMLLFAILMLFASISMIRSKKVNENEPPQSKQKMQPFKLILFGVGVGIVTGFLGAGGGFLLIPTLVLLVGLPMKEAIGTSLSIIALNSLIGFA